MQTSLSAALKMRFCVKCTHNEPGKVLNPLANSDDSDSAFEGYFDIEKATKSQVLRDVFKSGDAYYRTGDLMKRDRGGRLWFLDLVGDTFRWKSENVSTADVSHTIGLHPEIVEVNVNGVDLPKPRRSSGLRRACARQGSVLRREFGEGRG